MGGERRCQVWFNVINLISVKCLQLRLNCRGEFELCHKRKILGMIFRLPDDFFPETAPFLLSMVLLVQEAMVRWVL